MNNALKKSGKDQRQIKIRDVELIADESRVFVKGEELMLSPLEFKLLLTLCQNAGHTMTREVLLEKIWDAAGNFVEDNTLTVYIRRIRAKLGESDIIQTIRLRTADNLVRFCQGIQKGSPVDSFAAPVPAPMPGYESPVVMAAGTFIQGASLELSCDGPLREPYLGFLQGGLTYESGKLGVLSALSEMLD